ncbi:MAG: enoyl-CoA hydratase/isomerase family protein [Dehalococcoidia bacterium]
MPEFEQYDPQKHGRDTPQSVFGPVVKVDKAEGGKIHVITLNRPHRLNSIGDGLGEALYDAFADFRDDPGARVAILTGAGRAFCAGADLIATSETRKAGSAPRRPAGPAKNPVPLSEGMNLWKPTIAAINGFAIAGGFMYAMQCDIRVMAESARVGVAEARWNMGGAGWMVPITRQIGLGSALELTLWGDTQYTAERCYQLGWAQRVVPDEQLMDTAMAYAQRALDMAPRAVRNMKQALYRGYYMDPLVGQAFGAAVEQNLAGMQDSVEGPTAFSEKRRPNFIDA